MTESKVVDMETSDDSVPLDVLRLFRIGNEQLDQLAKLCSSEEIRDFDVFGNPKLYSRLTELIATAFLSCSPSKENWPTLSKVYSIAQKLLSVAEFDVKAAAPAFTRGFLTSLVARFSPALVVVGQQQDDEIPEHVLHEHAALRGLVHAVYWKLPASRPQLRSLIGDFLGDAVRKAYPRPLGIAELCEVVASFVKGFQQPLHPAHVAFFAKAILPLHRIDTFKNELEATISSFHPQLVFVLTQFIQKDASLLEHAVREVVTAFPVARMANSVKEILLLHELEKLCEFADEKSFPGLLRIFGSTVAGCASSDNNRVAERALQMWQNARFARLCTSDECLPLLLPALVPAIWREKHWNVTVNTMRGAVLSTLLAANQDGVVKHLNLLWKTDKSLEVVQERIKALTPPEEKIDPEVKLLETQVKVPVKLGAIGYMDFVHGHVLGEGSFSSVRYAKHIQRQVLPSKWREYALKIIDKAVIAAQKYEANIQREIAIMQALEHPNITQLVGTCSSPTQLYLVLEYAHKGDLHNHLSRMGSLSESSARVLFAEIVSALECIHGRGIVFGDLKPENVLVHQSGHIKLADFGSARFVKDISKTDRVEGTADYLSPEVVKSGGGELSFASDLWAAGCVLYQMLAGRAPIWAGAADDDDTSSAGGGKDVKDSKAGSSKGDSKAAAADAEQQAVFAKIVRFAFDDTGSRSKFPAGFPDAARDLVEKLMRPSPSERLGVSVAKSGSSESKDDSETPFAQRCRVDFAAIKQHAFFKGVDWEKLHTQTVPQMSAGVVAPAPDKKWTRRKNSMMWSPMPKAFSFAEDTVILPEIPEDAAERARLPAPSADDFTFSIDEPAASATGKAGLSRHGASSRVPAASRAGAGAGAGGAAGGGDFGSGLLPTRFLAEDDADGGAASSDSGERRSGGGSSGSSGSSSSDAPVRPLVVGGGGADRFAAPAPVAARLRGVLPGGVTLAVGGAAPDPGPRTGKLRHTRGFEFAKAAAGVGAPTESKKS